jgi:hypothetical protein
MRRFCGLAAAVLGLGLVPGVASAATATHSDNLQHVKNLQYEIRNGGIQNFGTDIEFANVAGRQYALAGSYRNGMQIVDITDPEDAKIAAVYDCGVTQGDVQVFRQADKPGRVFASYASDTFGDGTSTCYREAEALGFEVKKENGTGKNGTFILEITDPLAPKTVSFVEVAQGSHNQTIHPSGNFLYNSNSDLITSFQPAIEVFDISNFAAPTQTAELSLPTRPGLGTESHDITFGKSGDRAYSAALSQGVVIDTEDPARPEIISSYVDPTINVWHQSDPFTLKDANGNQRDFVLTEDEFAGAAGGPVCPSGGFHVYEVTGDKERSPEKVGYWNIDDARTTTGADQTCTAHVFRIHEEEQLMTVAFYNGGVRVVDLAGLAGGDGPGMKEIAFYRFDDSDTWSVKAPRVSRSGDFYMFGNDIARGLDVYRFKADAAQSANPGTWLGASEASAVLAARPQTQVVAGRDALFCVVGR